MFRTAASRCGRHVLVSLFPKCLYQSVKDDATWRPVGHEGPFEERRSRRARLCEIRSPCNESTSCQRPGFWITFTFSPPLGWGDDVRHDGSELCASTSTGAHGDGNQIHYKEDLQSLRGTRHTPGPAEETRSRVQVVATGPGWEGGAVIGPFSFVSFWTVTVDYSCFALGPETS